MPRQSTTDFVEVHRARLQYEEHGEGHPLLLIHGGLADMRMWDGQMEAFAARYRVIRFDMRGFGLSAMPPGDFSFHADIAGLLDALGIRSAFLLGLSLGGAVALDFALEYPRRVDGLVLAASGIGGYRFSGATMQEIGEIDAMIERGDIEGGVERELRLWIDGPMRRPDEVDPEVRERSRRMNAHNYQVMSEEGTPAELDPPALERLEELQVPTLVVVGDRDIPDMLDICEVLEKRINEAERAVVEGVAHHLSMEKPGAFNTLVLDFLSRVESSWSDARTG